MAGPNGHFRASRGSRIQYNNTNLLLENGDVEYAADEIDTTNFEANGVFQGTYGIAHCVWSFQGKWNAQTNAYDSPPGIFPSDSAGPVKFFLNVSDNVFFNFPVVLTLSTKIGMPIKQAVTFQANGKANGSFSIPTGSV